MGLALEYINISHMAHIRRKKKYENKTTPGEEIMRFIFNFEARIQEPSLELIIQI